MEKMKIVVLDGYAANPGDLSWVGFEAFGEMVIHERSAYKEHEVPLVLERVRDADIVLLNKTLFPKEAFAAAPKLRYIGVLATGYNIVDIDEAKKRQVAVTNVPAYASVSVSQMTMALLLELTNRVGHHSQQVHQGRWAKGPDWCFQDYPMVELAGKTLGIIGYGNIGRDVARKARAFDMEILATSRSPVREDGVRQVELEELLRRSDVVSLHCPLFPETRGIINRDTLALMKPGAFLINTSRGPLIREDDLIEALKEGRIAGAALDVVELEPLPADSALLNTPNLILTPHLSWATKEARIRLLDIALQNMQAFFEGEMLNRIV